MKVVLDTNIYISWIREKRFSEMLLDVRTQKYMPCHVLMELWAGAKTKQSSRLIEKLQKPYIKANRIIELTNEHFIRSGQILSDIPQRFSASRRNAGFLNDIFIAISAISIGATLYARNKSDFELIRKLLPELKVSYA